MLFMVKIYDEENGHSFETLLEATEYLTKTGKPGCVSLLVKIVEYKG